MKKTKANPKNKVNELMKKLNIDETYTKAAPKYKFDKVKQNTFPMQDYNFMMDTMELPKTKLGYKHLLTVVDLWSDEVDFEPLKGLTAKEALEGFKKIIKRPHLNLPKGSIRSDNGGEFKAEFDKFLKDKKILHRFSLEYRHKQNANVENLNSMLGRILMTYLTNKEIKIDKPYNEWTDILPLVRKELNNMRKRPDGDPFNLEKIPFNVYEPKFKVGDKEYDVKEEEDCEECGGSYMEEEEEGGDDFEEMLRGRRKKHSYVDNGEETPDEMGEEKKCCEKCGKEMCECGGGGMYESKKKTLRLSETELTKMIAKMVSESIPGLDAAKKSHTESGKENKANIASVEKKIADFNNVEGNDNPKFPNAIPIPVNATTFSGFSCSTAKNCSADFVYSSILLYVTPFMFNAVKSLGLVSKI